MYFLFASLLINQSSDSRLVTIREPSLAVSQALAEVTRQTGVPVRDDRGNKDESIALDLERVSFWKALDTIALRAKAKVSASRDGVLCLVRLAPNDRVPPTDYDGEFRFRVLRVQSSLELDSARAGTTITVETTWTPTLRPLFLDTQATSVRLFDGRKKSISLLDEGSSLAPVDGRSSFSIDISAPALPRSEPRISLLEGQLNAVVPTKWLTFKYDADLATLKDAVVGGEVRRLAQDDVVCRVDRVMLEHERWSVRVNLEYPAGGKVLESFQAGSLVVNNELHLISADGKRTLAPSGFVIDSVSSRRATVTYHFTDKAGLPRGAARQWRPRFTAPARIVDQSLRFRFRDVPLP